MPGQQRDVNATVPTGNTAEDAGLAENINLRKKCIPAVGV